MRREVFRIDGYIDEKGAAADLTYIDRAIPIEIVLETLVAVQSTIGIAGEEILKTLEKGPTKPTAPN